MVTLGSVSGYEREEAARYIGVSVRSFGRLVQTEQIRPIPGPRKRKIYSKEELDNYLSRNTRAGLVSVPLSKFEEAETKISSLKTHPRHSAKK